MHGRLAIYAIVVIAGLAVAACTSSASPAATATPSSSATSSSLTPMATTVTFPTTKLRYHSVSRDGELSVELARTPPQLELGLGDRGVLPQDAGMLFDLHGSGVHYFWMKGMRFALDFVWIGEDKGVVGITPDAQPQPGATDVELRRYALPVGVPYVLEINGGAARRLGIDAGTQLSFDIGPP